MFENKKSVTFKWLGIPRQKESEKLATNSSKNFNTDKDNFKIYALNKGPFK